MVEPFGISPEPYRLHSRRFFNVREIMDAIRHACCFTVHRPKYFHFGTNEQHPDCLKIKAFVREQCEYLITQKGVTHFISGGAVGLDTWAMEEVIALRDWHRRITLECVLPYAGMIESFAIADRERFYNLEAYINTITSLNDQYRHGCMQQRNMYMVDHAEYVIAVWNGQKSGTANTVKYAKKRKRTMFCLSLNS